MSDPRHTDLARVLVRHSCAVKPGDKVLIEAVDTPEAFVCELVRAVAEAGGHPLVSLKNNAVLRQLLLAASEEQMEVWADTEALRMSRVQAYIGLDGARNASEFADVPQEHRMLYRSIVSRKVYRDVRDRHTRWVGLRWPSPALAQAAGRSTADFEDFFFRVCAFDYAGLSRAAQPLKELLERTDRVRITAPGTDLTFSVRGMGAVICDGRNNLPDGEVFTAPVKDSVEGTVCFNTVSRYFGAVHSDVRLTFEKGRVTHAVSSDSAALHRVLDVDEGARFLGEFAFGLHPGITEPMQDVLFDEKIAGSVHLALGSSLEPASNGNQSQVHWDLVLLLRSEHGGGEVFLDDRLISKDGEFVVDELAGLNPGALLG